MWFALTEAQATLLNGILTLLAALGGVLLGGKIFGGTVSDLQNSLAKSRSEIDNHLKEQEKVLKSSSENQNRIFESLTSNSLKLSGLVTSVSQKLNAMGNSLNEISEGGGTDVIPFDTDSPSVNGETDERSKRQQLKADWIHIRDVMERQIFSDSVDDQRRAEYLTVDKRNYRQFFDAVRKNDDVPEPRDKFAMAVDLWVAHRSGRREVDQEAVEQMKALRESIDSYDNSHGADSLRNDATV